MKKYIISVLFVILAASSLKSQTVNWAALNNKEKHILNANIGTEYGVIFGLGYGYKLNTKWFPMITGVEFSVPSGGILLDDFKAKAGANIRWVKVNDFQLSTRVQGSSADSRMRM